MICPICEHDNVPGVEFCEVCLADLTRLDLPAAQNRVERSLMEDRVRVLRPATPIVVAAEAPLREAVQLLLEHNIGALLVLDGKRLVGIFTERDLLNRAIDGARLDTGPVRDFMTPQPETVTPDDTLAFALHKMDGGGYRHLPVIVDGAPVGIISARDMLQHFTRLCKAS